MGAFNENDYQTENEYAEIGETVVNTTGGHYAQAQGTIPEVNGMIDLSRIVVNGKPMTGYIRVYPKLRIEDCRPNKKTGEWKTIGFGPTFDMYARNIYIRVTSQEAFEQRAAKIAYLKEIDKIMQENPKGGYFETASGMKYLRPMQTIEDTQSFEESEY